MPDARSGTRYYGKYRGTVVNNVDPMNTGRIQSQVPDVFGTTPSSWAMPCLPLGGPQTGMFTIPPVGAGVWMEFEQGNPDNPIWTGCWWGSAAEVPALALATSPALSRIVLQTQLQNALVVSDAPGPAGGIMLKTMTGAMIMINETGIVISNGQGATISLVGPSVTVNNGALLVT